VVCNLRDEWIGFLDFSSVILEIWLFFLFFWKVYDKNMTKVRKNKKIIERKNDAKDLHCLPLQPKGTQVPSHLVRDFPLCHILYKPYTKIYILRSSNITKKHTTLLFSQAPNLWWILNLPNSKIIFPNHQPLWNFMREKRYCFYLKKFVNPLWNHLTNNIKFEKF
jgi:hypothetical protein